MDEVVFFPASDSDVDNKDQIVERRKQQRNVPAEDLVKKRCMCSSGNCFQQFAGREAEITKTRMSFQSLQGFRREAHLLVQILIVVFLSVAKIFL